MPRPPSERLVLQRERAELRGQMAACWQELENGSPRRARRELLERQTRKAEKRLANIGARLVAMRRDERTRVGDH